MATRKERGSEPLACGELRDTYLDFPPSILVQDKVVVVIEAMPRWSLSSSLQYIYS